MHFNKTFHQKLKKRILFFAADVLLMAPPPTRRNIELLYTFFHAAILYIPIEPPSPPPPSAMAIITGVPLTSFRGTNVNSILVGQTRHGPVVYSIFTLSRGDPWEPKRNRGQEVGGSLHCTGGGLILGSGYLTDPYHETAVMISCTRLQQVY
jgi:hypothetical protein